MAKAWCETLHQGNDDDCTAGGARPQELRLGVPTQASHPRTNRAAMRVVLIVVIRPLMRIVLRDMIKAGGTDRTRQFGGNDVHHVVQSTTSSRRSPPSAFTVNRASPSSLPFTTIFLKLSCYPSVCFGTSFNSSFLPATTQKSHTALSFFGHRYPNLR